MKHQLDITKGEWTINDPKFIGIWAGFNTYQGKVRGIYAANDDLEAICLVPKDYVLFHKDQDHEANAKLICDAGNTYQSCGELPSELLRQRDELKEALNHTLVNLEARVQGVEHKDWFKRTFAKEIETLKNCE